jgi:pimeloyl-ACP methyl ester carboxylesterase
MPRVHAPLLLYHGSADHVLPQAMGRALFAAANQPKQAVWVNGAGHEDAFDYPKVQQAISSFIQR